MHGPIWMAMHDKIKQLFARQGLPLFGISVLEREEIDTIIDHMVGHVIGGMSIGTKPETKREEKMISNKRLASSVPLPSLAILPLPNISIAISRYSPLQF